MPVILSRLLNNLSQSSGLAIEYLQNKVTKRSDIFSTINSLPNYKIFRYILIIICAIIFMSFITININRIFAIGISIIIINYFISKDDVEQEDFYDTKDAQIKFLNACMFNDDSDVRLGIIDRDYFGSLNEQPDVNQSYLHLDPLIVEFFYDIREYALYNLNSYRKSLRNVNNIILLYHQIKLGVDNIKYNIDVIKMQRANAINNLHSIIYTLPSTIVSNDKFNRSLKLLQQLTVEYVNDLNKYSEKQFKDNDITINSYPAQDYGPKPNPAKTMGYSKHYDFFY